MIEGTLGYSATTIALFVGLVLLFVGIDLFAHRKDKPVSLKDALAWSFLWVLVSLGFAGYLGYTYGEEKASLFISGYALEKVLSVDNLMVFIAIFNAFSIPEAYRHRILYWGIIGAILFRLVFVVGGAALYALGPWVEFVFAGIIAFTAYKMLSGGDDDDSITDYSNHFSVRWTQRIVPVVPKLIGHNFFASKKTVEAELAKPENQGMSVVRRAAFYATPMFLCLVCIEFSDVLFAFDSVPAVIAVTKDPLLVYSAMMFAILGLRSMYFVLDALQRYMAHLEKAIIVLLFFIAFKLTISAANHMFGWPGFTIDPNVSLAIVLGTLAVGVIASIIFPSKDDDQSDEAAKQNTGAAE
ncbi:TerC/Alx family metal homeostasis membrane protein [Thalassospira xiamenensis]|uniref:Tellurite resistance protein TerC n=1 Tax=Thalassospira xiamenensis TaxID=220697 RepID=A0A285TS24_9PROT|nr:TerC/Alx family metal homeostasis membrane protein [Thalassospira xiamenensis]SOC26537.1 tellurite resistance protein TerC [Thalassospira xiamenensis]